MFKVILGVVIASRKKKSELRWTDQGMSGENTSRKLYKVRRKGKEGQMKFARLEGGS